MVLQSRFHQKGFTIVELLIVIVIIGILAALVVVAYNGIQARSQASRATTELKQLAKIINLYYQDNMNYPCFDHLWSEAEEREWSSLYTGNWPKNPWGYEYHWEHGQSSVNYSISVRLPGQDQAQNIDTIADDGNLSTGLVRGNGTRLEYGVDIDQSATSTHAHCV